MRRRIALTLLGLAISGSVLAWLLSAVDLARLEAALEEAEPARLLLILPLNALVQALRGWRFELLLLGRTGLPSARMLAIAVHLIALNFVLPFKLGELSFPILTKRAFGTPYSRAIGVLLVARLLDVGAVAAVLLVACAVLLAGTLPPWLPPLMLVGAIVAPFLPLLLAGLAGRLGALAARHRRPLLEHLLSGGASLTGTARQGLALALTLAAWLCHAAIGWLAVSAIDPDIPVAAAVLAVAASNLAFTLPVPTIAGLGPPQAAWAGALAWAGVGFESAVLSALVCQAVILLGIALLWLAVWLLDTWFAAGNGSGPGPGDYRSQRVD